MITAGPDSARVDRRIDDFERQFGGPALRLAAHAALPVVLTPELLHLIRINFLQDPEARVSYSMEAKLLLSTLCREIGAELFEIDSDVRTGLLSRLERDYGEQRIREVAALLMQYTLEASPWVARPQLERAQQLTALNFLAPLRAQEWLDSAAEPGPGGRELDHHWFVAMRKEMIRGQKRVASVVSQPADPASLYEALTRLDFKPQLAMARSIRGAPPTLSGLAQLTPALIHGPDGYGQRWVLDLILRQLPPAELLVLPISISGLFAGFGGIFGALLGRISGDLADKGYLGAAVNVLATRLASHDIVLAFQGTERRFGDLATEFWKFWDEFVISLGRTSIEREHAELHVFLLGTWEGGDIPDALIQRPLTIFPRLETFTGITIAEWLSENRSLLPPELTSDVAGMAARIIAGSDGGIPEHALRFVAESCRVPWTDIEAMASAEKRWQPALPGPDIPPEALELADEYNRTRSRMPSGPDRTRAMEAIVAKMRRVEATPDVLTGLLASPSAGARLLAVVVLQQRPEATYLPWLAQRLDEEKPFVGYHAAVALERAAERLDESHLDAVENAIVAARAGLGSGRDLTDRRHALDRAQIVLEHRRAGISEKARKPPARKRARGPASYQAAETPWNLWPKGTVLRVRFLDGDPFVQDLVKRIAPQWIEHTNLTFSFLPAGSAMAADIRVSFQADGTWSYLGTQAMEIPIGEPTLNLGEITSTESDELASMAILRAFGHALGLVNEHQSPNADIPWDVDAIIDVMARPPNNWTQDEVRRHILTKFHFRSPPAYRDFDPDSVMLYPFPKDWTRLAVDVGGASTLSASDRAFIRRLYPPDPSSESDEFVESAAPAASNSSA